MLSVRSLSVEGAKHSTWQMVGYTSVYFLGGACLGLAIGVLFQRRLTWCALGLVGALLFACAGEVVAE